MKRLTQAALVCALMLALASLAAAQGTLQVPSGTPQPAMRFGNFIEVGNDVLMHIIATTDFRYNTTTNFDFESKVRDRVGFRNPQSSVEQGGGERPVLDADALWGGLPVPEKPGIADRDGTADEPRRQHHGRPHELHQPRRHGYLWPRGVHGKQGLFLRVLLAGL